MEAVSPFTVAVRELPKVWLLSAVTVTFAVYALSNPASVTLVSPSVQITSPGVQPVVEVSADVSRVAFGAGVVMSVIAILPISFFATSTVPVATTWSVKVFPPIVPLKNTLKV